MFSGKRFALIAALTLSLVIPMQSPASADQNSDEKTLQPEQGMLWQSQPVKFLELAGAMSEGPNPTWRSGERPWSYSFIAGVDFDSVAISNIKITRNERSWFCDGWNDPICRQVGNKFYATLYLPPCSEDATYACIESLNMNIAGNTMSGKLIRTLDTSLDCTNRVSSICSADVIQSTKFASVPSVKIPSGSAPSLWSVNNAMNAAGTDTYLASAKIFISGSWDANLNLTNVKIDNFASFVIPFKEITGYFTPGRYYKADDGYFYGSVGTNGSNYSSGLEFAPTQKEHCAWTESGKCGVAAAFVSGTRIELGLRVAKELDGWLQGRLANANVDIQTFDKNLNKLTISGEAIEIPVSGTFFHPQVTAGWPSRLGTTVDPYSNSLYRWSPGDYYSDGGVKMLNIFEKDLGDRAIGRVSVWSAALLNESFSCENTKVQRIEGLLTTNALVYEGEIPTYKNGSLSYQVGGLHYNHDGTVFKGSYDFIMRSDTARCIYGFTKAPVQVAVTVTDVNGVPSASTSSVSESGGWLRIRARDFTFSTPTINAKITQKLSTSVKNDKISQKALAKIAKVSIGKKDKVTVSVSGGNKKFAKVTSGNVSFKKNGTYQVKIKVKHHKGNTETATITVKVK